MKHFCALLALAAVLLSVWRGTADDWPLGGHTGSRNPVSAEKKPPTEWLIGVDDASSRNVRWSVPLGSRSIGGPIIASGLVWVGTNNERPLDPKVIGDYSVLACFRESDGKFLYQYTSPRLPDFPQDWPKQSLSGSPLTEDDHIWFCTNRREVICLDVSPLRKGKGEPKVVWRVDMVKEFGIRPRALMIPSADSLGSPVAYKDLLFVPTGNGMAADAKTLPAPDAPALVCLKKDTGKVVWKYTPPGKNVLFGHYSSPLVVTVAGKGQVVMAQADGWVRAFEAETGKPVWQFDVNGKKAEDEQRDKLYVVGTPIFAEGRVYFAVGLHPEAACGPGRLFCIDPTKTGDLIPVWEFSTGGERDREPIHHCLSSVAVSGGLVIAADAHGIVHCLNALTGQRHWFQDTRDRIVCSPLIVDGTVFIATDAGVVWVFELNKAKKVIAKRDVERSVIAPLVFANGTLYILTDGHLYAIANPGKP